MNAPYAPPRGPAARVDRWRARLFERAEARVRRDVAVVSVTFDDFPRSAGYAGAEILEAAGARGTYYVSAGLAGSRNHLGALFDPQDLIRLHDAGHEIACHTAGHHDLAAAADDDVLRSVAENAATLAAYGVKTAASNFAYPYGEASPAAKRVLSQRFDTLRGVRPGVNRGQVDRALLRAVEINSESVESVIAHVADAAARGGWLILYTHDVRESPSRWGCRPGELTQVVRSVVDRGLEIATVADAARRALTR